ncbi:hypothetical protein [Streptomyces sp. NPDC127108]|uniref:hypothetical protein n=1 Tax=Streptomyces sp. NPDC127108 TaxID=3345361 RepID=UPI0036300AA8
MATTHARGREATLSHRRATRRTTRWAAGLVLAALAPLTVVGCGDSDDTDDRPPSQGKAGKTSKSPTAQASSDEPSAKPSVSAADGSDVGACADGDCEITVSEKVTFRFKGPRGQATLSVTEVGPNKVAYTVKSGSGRSKGGATGPGQGCITVLRSNGSGNSCGGLGDAARPSPQPEAVVIQAATGEDGTAILHIVSR